MTTPASIILPSILQLTANKAAEANGKRLGLPVHYTHGQLTGNLRAAHKQTRSLREAQRAAKNALALEVTRAVNANAAPEEFSISLRLFVQPIDGIKGAKWVSQ
jgi:hypothetical protein